jgi:hypothetical protein
MGHPDDALVPSGLAALRDAFCTWRHRVHTGGDVPPLMLWFLQGLPRSVRDLEGADATLVCHLIPVARAYGFKICIGHLTCTWSTEHEFEHCGKSEFIDLDINKLSHS